MKSVSSELDLFKLDVVTDKEGSAQWAKISPSMRAINPAHTACVAVHITIG
jgi:hypothetical protein